MDDNNASDKYWDSTNITSALEKLSLSDDSVCSHSYMSEFGDPYMTNRWYCPVHGKLKGIYILLHPCKKCGDSYCLTQQATIDYKCDICDSTLLPINGKIPVEPTTPQVHAYVNGVGYKKMK